MPEPTAQAPAKKLEKDHVEVRVLKLGHEKIHTGESANGVDEKFKHGDKFAVHKDIAQAHEDKGLVEIL